MSAEQPRPPLPPFTLESATQKVRLAEDGWNSRDADKVSLAYSLDTQWRNRAEFTNGREEARQFLARKWNKELEYRLIKELWAFTENRIAVRYAYEWHDDSGNWFRSYGNENWEFGEDGLMQRRFSCINDMPIKESDRKFHWPLGRRPDPKHAQVRWGGRHPRRRGRGRNGHAGRGRIRTASEDRFSGTGIDDPI